MGCLLWTFLAACHTLRCICHPKEGPLLDIVPTHEFLPSFHPPVNSGTLRGRRVTEMHAHSGRGTAIKALSMETGQQTPRILLPPPPPSLQHSVIRGTLCAQLRGMFLSIGLNGTCTSSFFLLSLPTCPNTHTRKLFSVS